MGIEEKGGAGGDDGGVQVRGTEDEGARPVGQAAGALTCIGGRLEEAVVDFGPRHLAEESAECAAHDIGADARREADRVHGLEPEAKAIKLKYLHGNGAGADGMKVHSCCIMVRHLTLVYRFVRFLRGGCVSSTASPFFVWGGGRSGCN